MPKTTGNDNSSGFSPTQSNSSLEEEEFHPIACSSCRKIHKKCDRRKPSCSRCLLRGISCEYKEPVFKKVPKKPTNNNANNQNTSEKTSINSLLSNRNIPPANDDLANKVLEIKQNTVEAYCTIICIGTPPIAKEHLEKLIYINYSELLQNRLDALCLLLTIQGLCEQRFGFADLAEETMKKARDILSKNFDAWENPYIVISYLHLAFYYGSEGQMRTSRFYSSFVEQYFKEVKNDSSLLFPELNIFYMRVFYLVTKLIAAFNYPFPDTNTLEKGFIEILGLQLPEEWKLQFSSEKFLDVSQVEERLRVYDLVSSMIVFKMKDIVMGLPLVSKNIHDYYLSFIKNGSHILVLSLAGYSASSSKNSNLNPKYFDILEQSSLNITFLTENELLSHISAYMIPFILIGFKVNLEIAKAIDRGERENLQLMKVPSISVSPNINEPIDYFVIISKDLRALQVLSKRYRYIAPFMKEIDELLQKRFDDFTKKLMNPHGISLNDNNNIPMEYNPQRKWNRVTDFYREMKKFIFQFNRKLEDNLPNIETLSTDDNVIPAGIINHLNNLPISSSQAATMINLLLGNNNLVNSMNDTTTNNIPNNNFGNMNNNNNNNSIGNTGMRPPTNNRQEHHSSSSSSDSVDATVLNSIQQELFSEVDPLFAHDNTEVDWEFLL
ncbi:hypothetical protein ABK040_008095 [Willaertia magna]